MFDYGDSFTPAQRAHGADIVATIIRRLSLSRARFAISACLTLLQRFTDDDTEQVFQARPSRPLKAVHVPTADTKAS